ncbi:alpha-amylase domain-containing protein [Enterococcus mundtii]|nr:alpha-amylase domain-containing protein [Enterococcus mundtii]
MSQVLNSSSNWINKRIQVDYSSNSIWGHGGNVSSEGLKAVLREIREV